MTERPRLTTLGLGLALAALVLAAFYPTLTADFITYDDPFYVYDNPPVRAGLSWATVQWAFTAMHASNWHPLTWLSHALDCQWFGLDARGHHATNVVLHFLNSLLVYLLLRQLTGARWRSALVAGLFAVHPLHVESVAWVSERKDVLSAFFGLLTLLAYARYVTTSNVQSRESKASGASGVPRPEACVRAGQGLELPVTSSTVPTSAPYSRFHPLASLWYWLALVFFALGLMSKPMLVTWPCVMLLLDYWPLGRVASSGFRIPNFKVLVSFALRHATLLWEKLPFFALVAGSAVLTMLAQSKAGAVAPVGDITLVQRLVNAVIAYGWYVGRVFWPVDLAIIYPLFPTRDPWHFAASAVVLGSLTALALWQWRRRPYLFTGWFWFVGTLVPVVGLVQVGMQAYADRYTYLPYLGLFVMIAWALAEVSAGSARGRVVVAAGTVVGLLLATLLTHQQSRYWKDAETVFTRAISVTQSNYIALNNLGFVLAEQGEYDRAIALYQEALRAAPRFADAFNNLGCAYLGQKRLTLALPAFETAHAIKPDDVRILNNLATARHELGDYTNALAGYQHLLTLDPDYAEAHYNLANTLAALGQYTNSLPHYRRAIALRPDYAEAHLNLGYELLRLGQRADARIAFEKALAARTNFVNAHFGLANLAAAENDATAEAAHLRAYLAVEPDHAEARTRLAMAMATTGDLEGARREAQEAVRRHPDRALAWYCLGVIEEQRLQPGAAIAAYEHALRLNPDMPEVLNNLAWLLTTTEPAELRNERRAVELARRACKLTQFEAPMLVGTLAAAHAGAGQFTEAIQTAERAIRLAEEQGNLELAARNRELSERYRAGKPAK